MRTVLRSIRAVAGSVLDFALPPRCPGCGAVTLRPHDFCLLCWEHLDFLGAPCCSLCAEPFDKERGDDALCGACLQTPPAFDRLRAAVSYGDVARRVALRLKYGGRPSLAETMARRMARHVPTGDDLLLAAVPLHRWRLWRRGYNQSVLIARALARSTGLPLVVDLIERRKPTPVLRGLGPDQRRRAVRGAFRVDPRRRTMLKGKRVLLIDDVYTTGATVNACARVLRRAGAEAVIVLCWARVVRNGGPGVDKPWQDQQLQAITTG